MSSISLPSRVGAAATGHGANVLPAPRRRIRRSPRLTEMLPRPTRRLRDRPLGPPALAPPIPLPASAESPPPLEFAPPPGSFPAAAPTPDQPPPPFNARAAREGRSAISSEQSRRLAAHRTAACGERGAATSAVVTARCRASSQRKHDERQGEADLASWQCLPASPKRGAPAVAIAAGTTFPAKSRRGNRTTSVQ